MPGANDLAVVDHALAEWTASVQADIVHGAVRAVHVRDADVFVAAGEFFGLVWARQVGLAGQFDYGRHRFSVVRYRPGACPLPNYFGCRVWAIITWRLKFSTMLGSKRTSVGFFAIVMVSILSCSFSNA